MTVPVELDPLWIALGALLIALVEAIQQRLTAGAAFGESKAAGWLGSVTRSLSVRVAKVVLVAGILAIVLGMMPGVVLVICGWMSWRICRGA